jgi:hypothetical protein
MVVEQIVDNKTDEEWKRQLTPEQYENACPKITNIRGFIALLLYASNYYVCVNNNDASTNTMPLSRVYENSTRDPRAYPNQKSKAYMNYKMNLNILLLMYLLS